MYWSSASKWSISITQYISAKQFIIVMIYQFNNMDMIYLLWLTTSICPILFSFICFDLQTQYGHDLFDDPVTFNGSLKNCKSSNESKILILVLLNWLYFDPRLPLLLIYRYFCLLYKKLKEEGFNFRRVWWYIMFHKSPWWTGLFFLL